jgi:uncharacterized protein (TIGR03083 family)
MSKVAFEQAARFFVDTVGRVRPSQWDEPALGVWNVRDLVGHTARSITGVEQYAPQRADTVAVARAADHYHVALAVEGIDEQIAQRGKDAGADLGDDPLPTIQAALERALAAMNGVPEDTVIAYNNGGIRLADYLATRVLELVVHTLDLAQAIGADVEPPREALAVTLHLLADLAVDSGHGGKLALAATGRGLLPDRFSVLG